MRFARPDSALRAPVNTPVIVMVVAVVFAAVASGCGTSDTTASVVGAGAPPPTVGGVGELPDTVAPEGATSVIIQRPLNPDGSEAVLIGERADGNRVLLIGDSILASTTERYGGAMCAALEPLGWATLVEAQPSEFIDFGNRVLDEHLPPDRDGPNAASDDPSDERSDWDAAVVFLGSNYGGDPEIYESELNAILYRLSPRPVLLFTVTQYRPEWSEVNDVVWKMAERYDNVTVVDWEAISRLPGVLSSDRLHPSPTGVQVLADTVAAAMGEAPSGIGECRRSTFRDDSDRTGGSTGSGRGTSSGSSSRPSGGDADPDDGDDTGTPSTDPPSTDPPVTDLPTTDPPVTDPPVTDPPVTASPPTNPPATNPPPTDPPPTNPPPTNPPPTNPP